MVRLVVTLLHPSRDVAAAGDFPFMDVRHMTELFELLPDPECPVLVARRITDENIGHAHPLAGPLSAIAVARIIAASRAERKSARAPLP